MNALAPPPFAAHDLPADHPLAAAARPPERLSPIDAIVAAGVKRLADRLPPAVRVEAFPDKIEAFDFEGSDAAVLVIYDGGRFEEAGPVGGQGMRQTVRLAVVLLTRELRGPRGANGLIHEIATALAGESLAGSTGLRPIEAELEQESEGVWRHRVLFEARIPFIPSRRASQHPLLNRTPSDQI